MIHLLRNKLLWLVLIIAILGTRFFIGDNNLSIFEDKPEAGFHLLADGTATYDDYSVNIQKTSFYKNGNGYCGVKLYVDYQGDNIYIYDGTVENRCNTLLIEKFGSEAQKTYNWFYPICGQSSYAHSWDLPNLLSFKNGKMVEPEYADFQVTSGRFGASGNQGCFAFGRSLIVKPPKEAFNVDVKDKNNLVLFQGISNSIDLTIENNWKDIEAVIILEMTLNTAFGEISSEQLYDVKLFEGTNEIEVEIPTKDVTNEMIVDVKIRPRIPINAFSGVQIIDDTMTWETPTQVKKSGIIENDYLYFGEVYADTLIVSIDSKPLYLEYDDNDCTTFEGYELSPTGEFCIRNDIGDFSCVQRGCPSFDISGNSADYVCSSAGICVQDVETIVEIEVEIPVYIEQEITCEQFNPCDIDAGYVCQDNDNGFVKCVIDEYVSKKVTCENHNPCPTDYVCQDKFDGIVCKTSEEIQQEIDDVSCGFWCRIVQWFQRLFR